MDTRRRQTAIGGTMVLLLLATSAQAEFGDPLPGLTTEERERFDAGLEAFEEVEDVADGLGPVFNGDSCTTCHDRRGETGERVGIPAQSRVEEIEREVVLDVADVAPGNDGRLALGQDDERLGHLAGVRKAVVAGGEEVRVARHGRARSRSWPRRRPGPRR